MIPLLITSVVSFLGIGALLVLYKTRKNSADQIVHAATEKAKQVSDQAAKEAHKVLAKAHTDSQDI
ncbi:hypothetical protein EB093_02500, partial [bacterium]|nr:hypothetical protein [bacterium]